MPLCNTCSKPGEPHFCAKVTTKWKPKEAYGKDFCQHCDPDFHQDRIHTPVEQKLWLMADVNPHEYETVGGVRKMKDWADAEFGERLARDPDAASHDQIERAKAEKREQARMARRRPLDAHEIALLNQAYRGISTQIDATEGQ